MSGDYTRFTFDPAKVFSGVHKQQGRVSLDADFNEFEEILDRRDRSEMYDTVGHAVVPATTPDGFKIGVDVGGKLTIGIGRMYVDGLQPECFGDTSDPATTVFDATLGNLVGAGPLSFDAQPFAYPATPGITPGANTTDLVYLDVWQREVTAWEDQRLIDPALGGPDTATRVQTAWQVKALSGVPSDACTNPPTSWLDLIAPSTARMTAAASAAPPPMGPCVIQPAGGYTGMENRLYRVEIHDAGTLGGAKRATFTWSRDNASLVASVLSVAGQGLQSVITVESTGRDTWMRFEVSQQVELLDDDVELAMRESGVGGKVARITNVNHATGEITVDQNLAGPILAARHPRIRRWDTAIPADPAIRNVSNGVAILLEEGISVSWGDGTPAHADDTLHAGDYWVFSARTADGSIETVENAPPRGILHHFAPLAIVTSGAQPQVDQDCRDPWPPPCDCEGGGCECDFCVTLDSHLAGATIQQAVKDVINKGGGTVCIGIGVFPLGRDPIELTNAISVVVKGKGIATVLDYGGTGAAIRIEGAIDVSVRDLSLITERSGELPDDAIEVSGAALVTLERLTVIEDPIAVIGFLEQGATNRQAGGAVGLHGFVLRSTVRDCNLAGGGGVVSRASLSGKPDDDYLVAADLTIEHNLVLATRFGVALGTQQLPGTTALGDRTAIRSNSVFGCEDSGIEVVGKVVEGEVLVEDNTIGAFGRGITIATDRTSVDGNRVASVANDRAASGLSIARGETDIVSDVRFTANLVDSFGGTGVEIGTFVTRATVADNTVAGCGQGIVMTIESRGQDVRIANNEVIDTGTGRADGNPTFGILLVATLGGQVVDNTVRRVATKDPKAQWRAGIQAVGCGSVRIAGNTVSDIGPADFDGTSVGIGSSTGFETLDVVDNIVKPAEERIKGPWFALLIGSRDPWSASVAAVGNAIYWFGGGWVTHLHSIERPGAAAVRGNHFDAFGPVPAVVILIDGSCTFADNWCRQLVVETAVVAIGAKGEPLTALAAATNQVRQPRRDRPVAIDAWVQGALLPKPPSLAASVVGNVTDGDITLNGGSLPIPWQAINVRLS